MSPRPSRSASSTAVTTRGRISSKTASSSANPRAWISGRHDDLARVDVDDHEHRDEALGAEDAPVLERGLGDVADRGAVDVDEPAVHGADDLGDALDEVDDDAVLGEDHAVRGDAGLDGEVAVGPQVAVLAVDGHRRCAGFTML